MRTKMVRGIFYNTCINNYLNVSVLSEAAHHFPGNASTLQRLVHEYNQQYKEHMSQKSISILLGTTLAVVSSILVVFSIIYYKYWKHKYEGRDTNRNDNTPLIESDYMDDDESHMNSINNAGVGYVDNNMTLMENVRADECNIQSPSDAMNDGGGFQGSDEMVGKLQTVSMQSGDHSLNVVVGYQSDLETQTCDVQNGGHLLNDRVDCANNGIMIETLVVDAYEARGHTPVLNGIVRHKERVIPVVENPETDTCNALNGSHPLENEVVYRDSVIPVVENPEADTCNALNGSHPLESEVVYRDSVIPVVGNPETGSCHAQKGSHSLADEVMYGEDVMTVLENV